MERAQEDTSTCSQALTLKSEVLKTCASGRGVPPIVDAQQLKEMLFKSKPTGITKKEVECWNPESCGENNILLTDKHLRFQRFRQDSRISLFERLIFPHRPIKSTRRSFRPVKDVDNPRHETKIWIILDCHSDKMQNPELRGIRYVHARPIL